MKGPSKLLQAFFAHMRQGRGTVPSQALGPHHVPRQLRIKPHDPILSDREIRWMQHLRFEEPNLCTIDLRPLGLYQVEREGWRILHGRIALMPVIGSKP